jgi:regulator of protease activity HflC (stomatin/prohibitin superfamily)
MAGDSRSDALHTSETAMRRPGGRVALEVSAQVRWRRARVRFSKKLHSQEVLIMLFWKKVYVGDQERALVTRRGRFVAILTPGTYWLFRAGLKVNTYNLAEKVFQGEWAEYFLRARPDVVAQNFTEVATGNTEVALIEAEGRVAGLLGPGRRVLYWKSARVTAEVFDTAREIDVPGRLVAMAERLPFSQWVLAQVPEGHVGLLFVDNRFVRQLKPGAYGFWKAAAQPRVELVDMRRQTFEAPGQEILTRDKVSVRVNIAAVIEIADPALAKTAVRDWSVLLYQALQLAVRQSLGKRTLEQLLEEKTDVDGGVLAAVRAEMEMIGVRVETVALKDIVLPGEMREILNRVVAAEKEAQANLIRRREETAATRSLLNTAKLMEDNPVLVRLKELETLEKLSVKVQKITVTGGFDGLLDNLLAKK